MPKKINEISEDLFDGCTSLKTVDIPDGVKKIGEFSFARTSLTSLDLPDSVQSIDTCAFYSSKKLESIRLSDNISYIGKNVFSYCTNLTVKVVLGSYAHSYVVNNGVNYVTYGATKSNSLYVSNVTAGNTSTSSVNVSLASDFEISVPYDVPFIGGSNIKIDTSLVPVSASFKDNKLRVGIGCTDITNVDDNTWCDYKNYIQGYRERYEIGTSLKELVSEYGGIACNYDFDKDFKIDIYGYYEAVYSNNQVIEKAGLINIKVTGEAGKEWQTVVFSVPVVLKVKGEVGADIDLSLRYDTSNSNLYFDGDFELTLPKIRASAGVGIAYIADVSVYGQAENIVGVYSNPNYVTGTLKGEIGVSGKFLMFSGSFPILKSKDGWTYYDSRKKSVYSVGSSDLLGVNLDENDFTIDRSYLTDQSDWLQRDVSSMFSKYSLSALSEETADYTMLQTNVYNDALPQIIKTNDTIMMVWTADIAERTEGNHTAIVYSIYDEVTGIWAEPIVIDDDGTADFYPDITTDGDDIYITWVDVNTVFDANVKMDVLASACEINVAKYDAVNGIFSDVQTITDNSTIDINPEIVIKNSNPVVMWKNNSENSLIKFSGEDTLCYAEMNSDGLFVVNEVVSSSSAIYDFATDGTNVVYTADTDGNVSTQTDTEVFVGTIESSFAQISYNETCETDVQVSLIKGTQYFTYVSNGVIYGTTDMITVTALTDETCQVSGEYKFVSSDNTTKLIVTESGESSSNLYSWSLNNEGYWSNPVQLTDNNAYIRGADVVIDNNGDLQFVYLLTSAEIGEETVSETSNLCTHIIPDKHDITVNFLKYASEDVTEGSNLTVTADITNNGTYNETALLMEVIDDSGNSVVSITVETDIASGETTNIDIIVPLPEIIIQKYNYTVNITPVSNEDINISDNSSLLEFGYSNLQLSTNIIADGEEAGVLLSVNNDSCVPTIATLVIKDGNSSGEILDEYYLGSIDGNESLSYLLNKSMVAKYKLVTESIYLEIISYKDEVAVADNTDFAYVTNIDTSILADINLDGDISINDATLIQKYLAKFATLDEKQLAVIDVNGDGKISIRDVTTIQMYLAKIIDSFPIS